MAAPLRAEAGAVRPPFWAHAKRRLSAADPVLGGIIRRHPRISMIYRGDAFRTLARSIVGQQISVKAADSVWGRLLGTCGEMSPQAGPAIGNRSTIPFSGSIWLSATSPA